MRKKLETKKEKKKFSIVTEFCTKIFSFVDEKLMMKAARIMWFGEVKKRRSRRSGRIRSKKKRSGMRSSRTRR